VGWGYPERVEPGEADPDEKRSLRAMKPREEGLILNNTKFNET
jgi:hypothetical protein